MKISFNWLKQYVETELDAEQTARILTDIGLEVEGFEKTESIRGGLAGLVVGEVLTCEKHPDADKLHVTTVDLGDGVPVQIVCGAPNVAAGQKVVVATIGATLYPVGEENGFKIKKSKIRGVESFGMLCAEDEIGVGTAHDGIIVLPSDVKAGTPARDYFGIEDDYLLEIGLTPNRVDAASHYGVARDLAVYLRSQGMPCRLALPSVESFGQDVAGRQIAVEVLDSEAAPRYMGVTMTGLRVGPSPEWLQRRLRAIGMNPKNNVVDITNFVLHETGQPLHAFDASKIAGDRIVVRTCDEGTPFVTLDGVERKLSADDLMICNDREPMCIAGVFGGLDSGVTETTTDIFIESAYFNPVRVRKTAKRHGLNTDSSFRFERGVDPDMTPYALRRAAVLVRELAGGVISSPVTDLYPVPVEPFRFELSFDRVRKLIGKDIPTETIRQIVAALDVTVESESEDGVLQVAVPPYRVDVRREADLIEDILRIYGYNNVEIPQHVNSTLSYAPHPDRDKMVNLFSDTLSANGFNEIMSNSLTRSAYYEGLASYPAEHCVRILNPLSNDLNVMRQTLLFNMMEAIALNANHRNADLRLYEYGNCYFYDAAREADGGLAPYSQRSMISMAVTGIDHVPSWNVRSEPATFFTLRAAAEKVLRRFGLDLGDAATEPFESDLYREAVCCRFNGKKLLEMGVVSKKIRNRFDVRNEVYYLELDFDALLRLTRNHTVTACELSKYPEVRRDLALLLDRDVTFAQLHAVAFATEKKLLKQVALFDVYEGDKLPAGKKSYALSFVLEDTAKTLTDQVIDRTMNNLIRAFERQLGAQIRS